MSVASLAEPSSRPSDPSARGRAPWWPAILCAILLAGGLVGAAWLMHGKALTEKTLTVLVMPIGILWLVTSGRLLQCVVFGYRSGITSLALLWLMLMLLGTRPLPRMLARWIESSVPVTFNPARDQPLDVVIVLGGGTSQGPWRAQVSSAGDRLVLAAELYHQKYTQRLITTGQTNAGVNDQVPDPSQQTLEIWRKLAIQPEAIRTIGGRNTYEEMQQLKQIWPEFSGQRVGLLTSALHLPRAMRLARAQGLEMIPIAADVRSSMDDWGLLNFIPNAGNLGDLASTQHELMAWLVSR